LSVINEIAVPLRLRGKNDDDHGGQSKGTPSHERKCSLTEFPRLYECANETYFITHRSGTHRGFIVQDGIIVVKLFLIARIVYFESIRYNPDIQCNVETHKKERVKDEDRREDAIE